MNLFTRSRRPFLSAAIATIAGLGAGVLLDIATSGADAGGSGSGSGASEVEVERAEAPTTTDPPTPAEIAASVEVVDTGFTIDDRPYCPNSADQDPSDGCSGCNVDGCADRAPDELHLVSYGLTVHNRGDLLLERIPLTVTFRAASGEPIRSGGSSPTVEISRLLPGETLGLADIVEVDRGGTAEVTADAGTADVAISVDYARATADLAGLYEVTAGEMGVAESGGSGASGRPGAEWIVRFALRGSLPDDVAPLGVGARLFTSPQVIYRDAQGRIIGGSRGEQIEIGSTGRAATTVRNEGVTFVGLDPGRTEVYFTDFTVA